MSAINNLSSSYLQSILGTVLQGTGLPPNRTGASLNGLGALSGAQPPDSGQLSPFARLVSTLQQLQQSDPTKYQQVAQQIATNLQSAAQTAEASGNTTAANQLNQLATDFTDASKSGQLPNIQDLARALGGHHHHHSHAASTDGTDSSTASQANAPQSEALNPISIISNTLSNAGISGF